MSLTRLIAELLLTDSFIRLKSNEGLHSSVTDVPAHFRCLHFWIGFLAVGTKYESRKSFVGVI